MLKQLSVRKCYNIKKSKMCHLSDDRLREQITSNDIQDLVVWWLGWKWICFDQEFQIQSDKSQSCCGLVGNDRSNWNIIYSLQKILSSLQKIFENYQLLIQISIYHYLHFLSVKGNFCVTNFVLISIIIYCIKLKQSMSALKIPDLNLFTDKRKNRQKQYEAVKKQGLTLFQKTVNKQLLADIKGQLYLQNYQNSLKHFISPTKYKQRAQQILKTDTRQEQLLFKAISFPVNTYRCPNCFSKEIERKRCVCQAEQRVLPLLRSKSNDNKPSYLSTNNQREFKQPQQINNFSNQNEQEQPFQKQPKPLRIQTSVVTIETIKQRMQAQIENAERIASNRQKKRQLIDQNNKFRQELNKRQSQLHKIDLNLQDEKNQQLDLRDLIEAKDSYINKSKQILSSLDRILRLGSPKHES